MNPEQEHPLNALAEQATKEEQKKQIFAPSRGGLRTLEGDIQEAIQERNASTASMVMAEQAKTATAISQPQKQRPSNFNKKIFIILVSIILVILGLGGAYYLYLQSPLAPSAGAVQKPSAIPSIVSTDAQKTLDLTGLTSGAARAATEKAISNVAASDGSILQIIPVEKGSDGSVGIINASDFISLLNLPAPDVLSRSLNNQWMLGTYNDNGTASPFMILTDNFFQNAYAGMISWENTMPDDFVNIFGYTNKVNNQQVASVRALSTSTLLTSSSSSSATTSSATSTLSTSTLPVYALPPASYFNIQGSWRDGVIENKDVRAFYRPDGTMLILYSFVDNNTIIITASENALAEIINRLEKQTFTR
jgi:hypothetical protein